jgi:nuclear receptor interaction protein
VEAPNGDIVHEADADTTNFPRQTEGEESDRVGLGNETAEEQNHDSIHDSGDRIPTETPLREAGAAGSTARLAELVSRFAEEQLRPPEDPHPLDNPDLIGELQDHEIQDLLDQEDALFGDRDLSDDDGPSMLWGEEIDALYGINDEDEDEDEDWDEEDDFDMDDPNFDDSEYDGIAHSDDDDGDGPIYPDRRSEETEFGNVEMIIPRRIFKGAKNVETVKDCMLCIVTTSEDHEADKCVR